MTTTTTSTSTKIDQNELQNIINYARDGYQTYQETGYDIIVNRREFLKAMRQLQHVSRLHYLGKVEQDDLDIAVQLGFKYNAHANDVMVAIIGGRHDALKQLRG
jgi:hypothetical protein